MGKLVVVPTPVGNLQDMTFRAVEVLKQADLILAEDTRTSGNLLKHFGIETKMIAHHKFNEHATLGRTLDIIRETGNHFGYGMLNLQASIHFHKVEAEIFFVHNKFNSTSSDIAYSLGSTNSSFTQFTTKFFR